MLDKDQALGLLSGAFADLTQAKETLDTIRKEDGEVKKLRPKRTAVMEALDKVESALTGLQGMVAAIEEAQPVTPETPATPETPETPQPVEPEVPTQPEISPEPDVPVQPDDHGGTPQPATPAHPETPIQPEMPVTPTPTPTPDPDGGEPETPADLFSMEDQLAVSKLMQDSAVHLAVIRKRNFWEIRHRNTVDGQPSDPIRAETIAECYRIYEQQAVRKTGFEPLEGRPLTLEEQQALVDMRNMPIDNPRSVRWEKAMTEVDYIDKNRQPAGGRDDDVQFPPGELVAPIEFMKTVLS